MKKISEMTLEELRDYAISLEEKNTANEQAIAEKDKSINAYKDDIIGLQRRNNALFLKVEQQGKNGPEDDKQDEEDEKDVKSVEDTAKENYKEFLKL